MTDEQINAAIAEACGWADITRITSNGWLHKKLVGTHKKMLVTFDVHTPIPDYCNDLNAMHEAEKSLTPINRDHYIGCLAEMFGDSWAFALATARQRAEAFLQKQNHELQLPRGD